MSFLTGYTPLTPCTASTYRPQANTGNGFYVDAQLNFALEGFNVDLGGAQAKLFQHRWLNQDCTVTAKPCAVSTVTHIIQR